MLRTALLTAALLALAAPAASAQAPASVELTACRPGKRAAEFEAAMEAVPAAHRLRMRFTLEARRPGERRYRRLAVPGFGGWTTSGPGTARYVFTRRVQALVGPASYRALVRFRWVDAAGRVLAHAQALSRSCRQRDHRPDLEVLALAVGRGAYVARVANRGRSASGPFVLELTVDGERLAPVSVGSLPRGAERLVELHGPECRPGATAVAVADLGYRVEERSERDNAFTLTC